MSQPIGRLERVAMAVAAALLEANIPADVPAVVDWMPLAAREDSTGIECLVVPSAIAPKSLSRTMVSFDCEVLVALRAPAAPGFPIGGAVATLEAINEALTLARTLDTPLGQAAFIASRIEPTVDAKHWYEQNQYLGLLRVTYRLTAAVGGGE